MNKLIIILCINLSIFTVIKMSSNYSQYDHVQPKPSQNFLQFLEDCDYAPTCIKYLRESYPEDHDKIDAILLGHYIHEYRNALSEKHSKKEMLDILKKKIAFLIAEPDWIDNGYEPFLASTSDGSDRGGNGLRYKALMLVINEVKNTSEE